MKTQKIRIMAIAALLAIVTAGAPLWAQTYTVTAADFETVKVLDDGSGVTLENYIGKAPNIMIPAELEGLPVKKVIFSDLDTDSYGYTSTRKENTTIRSATIAEGFTAFNSLFQGCASLTSVTLPKGITKIGRGMFDDCKSLTSFTIPDSVTAIEDYAFSDTGIKELVIPGSVTKLGDRLFSYSAIERITLPAGLKEIPNAMFVGCKNLKSITLPAGLTAVGGFFGSGLQSIVIPDSVTKIKSGAFEDCKNLREVTMPRNLTELGAEAFFECSSLKRITIPAGVSIIEARTFTFCTALEEITFEGNITIPKDIKSEYATRMDMNVFEGCGNIKKLNAGPGVTKITGLQYIPMADVSKLPIKEQAEIKAAWSAFMQKYK